MRTLVALFGTAVAVLLGAGPVDARVPCRVGDGDLLFSSKRALAWQAGEDESYRLYGCWRRTGERTVLRAGSGAYGPPDVGPIKVSGARLALVTREALSTSGDDDTKLYSADLRRGRSREALLFRTSSGDRYRGRVTALALNRLGAVGFIAQYAGPSSSETSDGTLERVVGRGVRGDQRVLEQAATIKPDRLDLKESVLSWEQEGARRSAQLP